MSGKTQHMERGKSQVLFTFLPGKTFDYEGGRMICRVTEFEFEERNDLNKEWILRDLAKFLRGWLEEGEDRRSRLRTFPDPPRSKDTYVLADPTRVLFEIFPLAFQCRGCRRMTIYQNADQAGRKGLTCGVCQGDLAQIHHVQVHTCGHILPLQPPYCRRCKTKAHIKLDDRGSQAYANFRWVCLGCNQEMPDPLTIECPECQGTPHVPKDQLRMRPAVHRAGSAYYNQVRTLVNLPAAKLTQLLHDPDYRYLVVAAYLGMAKPEELENLAQGESGTGADDTVAKMEGMLAILPPEQRAMFEAQLAQMKAAVNASGSGRRAQLITDVKALLTAEGEPLDDLAKEILEYVRPGEPLRTRRLDDLKAFATRSGLTERLTDYAQYPREWEALGMKEIHVIENFPLATAVVGYTRVLREPQRENSGRTEKSVLRSFPLDGKNRIPIYVATQEAEALSVQLSPAKVMKWLKLNHRLEGGPSAEDEPAVRAWLLQQMVNVDAYTEVGGIRNNFPITHVVFSLVHSMSHLLLRHAVLHCGFDPQSLAEYLFPRALSFVIYANNLQGYTIGGLHTLFEQALHKWLRDAHEMGRMCVYDPVCAEGESACHACSHISEVSCTHFNRFLGRRYLFGGLLEDGSEYIGFWDRRVQQEDGV